MIVSVVVPTYNRNCQLVATVESLLRCDPGDLEQVEVLVVDDGSPSPVEPLLGSMKVTRPFSLRVIRRENGGPAAARNTGFRTTRGEMVLFVDDDILCPPDLIRNHAQAHSENPGSVIMGPYPFVTPQQTTPFYRYVGSLGYLNGLIGDGEDFVETTFIASGQISVERSSFRNERGVYREDLYTPVAEEYELAWHLKKIGVPAIFARRIVALHNRPVEVRGMCRQAFTHGRGCGEVASRFPEILQDPDLTRILLVNGPTLPDESFSAALKKRIKRLLGSPAAREKVLRIVIMLERVIPVDRFLYPWYRSALGLYFFAGVREGLEQFSPIAASDKRS